MIDLAERFYAKVAFDHPSRCWEWTAYRDAKGYGRHFANGKNRRAYRTAWELWHGRKIPTGKLIMHECDNPPCVNPYHLTLGTYAMNSQDAGSKGRLSKPGERNPRAKLSDVQAAEIRRRVLAGEVQQALADEYGVSRQLISYIKTGQRGVAR